MSDAGSYQVELEVFEGPLDLLLHLVRKHELDILDIPISFITEKYLEYLDLMQGLNLDVAGEYLLMAATLAHIKSRELLPTPDPNDEVGEDGEEEGDPRQDLIRRLLEYQKYKAVAADLGDKPIVGRNVWTRGAPREEAVADNIDHDQLAPLADIPVYKLLEAFGRVLEQARITLAHKVDVDRLSVSDRINQLADRLDREQSFSFHSCFRFLSAGNEVGFEQARHDAVVTFLALLEMAKLGLIRLSQPPQEVAGQDDIYISAAAADLREQAASAASTDDEYR